METKEDLIREISRKLLRILNKHARIEEHSIRLDEELEMTPKEIHTIQAIGENEQINITEVGAYFGVTKSAASQMIARLSEKGIVEKESAAHSNKELRLFLTELGWRAFNAHEKLHGAHMADLVNRLGAFTLSQAATTAALLEVIESVVDDRLAEL
jgi:DNA-binding MarR family transcriptional regulator